MAPQEGLQPGPENSGGQAQLETVKSWKPAKSEAAARMPPAAACSNQIARSSDRAAYSWIEADSPPFREQIAM